SAFIFIFLQSQDNTLIDNKTHQGLWVRAASMVHPDSIDRIIEIATEMGITDIYAQVVIGGYAYCKTKTLPRSQYLSKISGMKYDPLGALIKAAKKKKIKVHAWVNTLLAWSLQQTPDSNRHVYFTHPEWFIKDATNRSMRYYSYEKWVECGLEGLYLDPSQEEVKNFIASTCQEIAGKYAIAGVHLDFIRYPGTLWGLNINDTTALFAGFEGNDLTWMTFTRYPQMSFLQRWLVWHYWQEAKAKETFITQIVKEIQNSIKDDLQNPGLLLSAAIFPNPALSHYRYGQCWEFWQKVIDYPLAMAYTTNTAFFARLLDYCQSKFPGSIMGIGLIWPEMAIEGNTQYFITRDASAGTCIFDFTALDTMLDRKRLLKRELLIDQALPDMNLRKFSNVFPDQPPAKLLIHTQSQNHNEEINGFWEFLSSLSIDQNHDLNRMGVEYQIYRQNLSNDITAFKNLDSQVFPIPCSIDAPPRRSAVYTFTDWNKDDTIQTINTALNIDEFKREGWFYPEALNELSRSIFEAKIDTIDTCITRAGIYTFKVSEIIPGPEKVSRNSIPAKLLPVYLSWHLINKAKKVIGQY
ncbi:hypothetical protein A2Y85_05290, partial [candidate division WOR-3 bacterium RBG_13_43_14]